VTKMTSEDPASGFGQTGAIAAGAAHEPISALRAVRGGGRHPYPPKRGLQKLSRGRNVVLENPRRSATTDPPRDIALITNAFTPYGHQLRRRLAREIPQVRIHNIFTHEMTFFRWDTENDPVDAVAFGPGDECPQGLSLGKAAHEWRKGGRILRYLTEKQVSAVVIAGYSDAGRVRIALGCRRLGIPVYLFGDSNIRSERASGVRALAKRGVLVPLLRSYDGVLVCGTLGEEYYRRYGMPRHRIFRVPYEPAYALFDRVADDPRPRASRTILYSGRLVAVKRVDLLVRAFTLIAPDRPGWELAVIGDGPLRGELQGLVPESLRPRVRWAGAVTDQTVLAGHYRAADVLVLPSDLEPWGIVVTEAAAAGLALVTSRMVGAGEDLVVEGVNGRRFDAGDLTGLAAALREVTADQTIDRYRAASREVFRAWRATTDPVAGMRQALGLVEVVHGPDQVGASAG